MSFGYAISSPLMLHETTLEVLRSEIKILGIVISANLTWNNQFDYRIAKRTK